MMREEFERLAGYEVSLEDYENIIEPMYMATEMSKQDFVKCINRKRFEVKAEKKQIIKVMAIRDNSGYWTTPNGCYIHTVKVEVVDVSIKTGKIKVKVIPNSYELGYSSDFREDEVDVEVIA